MALNSRTGDLIGLQNALYSNYVAGKRNLLTYLGDSASAADFASGGAGYNLLTAFATNTNVPARLKRHNAELLALLLSEGATAVQDAILANAVAYGGIYANQTAMAIVAQKAATMNKIFAVSVALSAMCASSTAMAVVAASSTAMAAVIASSTARSAVVGSNTAMTALKNASSAIKTQMCNSADMMTALRGSSYKTKVDATGAATKSLSVSGTRIILQLVLNASCTSPMPSTGLTSATIGGTLVSGTAVTFSYSYPGDLSTITQTDNEAAVYTDFTASFVVHGGGVEQTDDFVCYYI